MREWLVVLALAALVAALVDVVRVAGSDEHRRRYRRFAHRMIRNDQELAVTRERVATFERMLKDLRETARPEEWPSLSSGYRVEIERMQRDILDYLVHAPPGAERNRAA